MYDTVDINSFMTQALLYGNQSIACGAKQWTGFCMITASVMKELSYNLK